jgi:hypothetical protein
MFSREDILELRKFADGDSTPHEDFNDYLRHNIRDRTFLERDYINTFDLPRDLFGSRRAKKGFWWDPRGFPAHMDLNHCFEAFVSKNDYLPYFGVIRHRWSRLKDYVGVDHAHAAIKKFMDILEQFLEEQTRVYGIGVVVEFSEALYSYCKMLLPEYRLALAMGQHSRLGASSLIRTLPSEAVELIMNVNCPITKATFSEDDID